MGAAEGAAAPPLAREVIARVIARGAAVALRDAPAGTEAGAATGLGVPVRLDGAAVGSLVVLAGPSRAWAARDAETLAALAATIEAELALRAELSRRTRAEAHYRALFDGSPDAVLVFDPETEVILDANPAACELYGRDRTALTGTSIKAFSRDTSEGEAQAARLVREGGHARFDTVQYRADGTPVDLRVSASAIALEGRPALLSINRDVTALRRAEAALRASEARFRGTFDNAAVGIAHTAPDGRWIRVNDRLCAILGSPREELLGRDFSDVTHPDDVAENLDLFQRALKGDLDEYTLEKRFVRKDGSAVWTELTVAVMRAPDGSAEYFISVLQDISARKAAEAARVASEARFRSLVESIHDAVLEVDEDGCWSYLSPAWERITGFTVEESLGRSLLEFVHPQEHERHRALFEALRREEVPSVQYVTRALAAGGGTRHVEVRARLRRDAKGAVLGAVGTVTDVTDTVRFEAEREARLRTAEMLRLKQAFLDNMNHELRTPLTAVLGFGEILAEEADGSTREYTDAVLRAGRRLQNTLDAVLELSQLEAGAVEIRRAPTDARAVAAEVVAGFAPLAAEAGLTFELTGSSTLALTDAAALGRVLHHVVGNAIKFTPAGRVTVDVAQAEDRALVRVEDTGIGVPAAFLPRMFEAFTQASDGYDRTHEGGGLGLAVARQLVDLLGGTLTAESEEGAGTTIVIALPTAQPVTVGPSVPTHNPAWGPLAVEAVDAEGAA